MQLKSLLRCLLAGLSYYSGEHIRRSKGKVTILMYHRILTIDEVRGSLIQPGMYVLDSTFAKHIKFLKEHYKIISFIDFMELLDTNEFDKDQAYCVITFDDGWRDNYINAFPVLRANGVPATIFLATSFIASDRLFWPESLGYIIENCDLSKLTDEKIDALSRASNEIGLEADLLVDVLRISSIDVKLLGYDKIIELLKEYSVESIQDFIGLIGEILELKPVASRMMLDWNEIREMSAKNISFGSHGCSHSLLILLSEKDIITELSDSLNILQETGTSSIPVFCYPDGSFNERITMMVKDAGYKASVTTETGYTDAQSNRYKLKRVGIHDDVTKTIPLFALHISGILKSLSSSIEKSAPE